MPRIVGLIAIALAFVGAWTGLLSLTPTAWGVTAVILLWVMSGLVTGTFNPLVLAEGADGRLSTSVFQFLLWTAVTVFTYCAIYASRYPDTSPLDHIPRNVLVAMGLSATTLAAAKGITVSYIASGRVQKPPAPDARPSTAPVTPGALAPPRAATAGWFGGLAQDDQGKIDLTKVQMLAWTLIAIFAYVNDTLRLLGHPPIEKFPDIDPALMVLMGLGHGAYLGNKLVTTDTPRITRATKSTSATGSTVTLEGQAFGGAAGTVMLDGYPLAAQSWTDTQIVFPLPAAHPSGQAWPTSGPPRAVQVSVAVGGQTSNSVPLSVP